MHSSDRDDRARRVLGGLGEEVPDGRGALPERYALGEEIGRGGMAVVYRARDAQLQRDVAVKLLRADLKIDDDARARFRREAGAAARLVHPHVVTVFDAGDDYLVMELVEGESLTERLAARPGPAEVGALLEKVASGVQAAHERGIVHRDLKPSNIMLTPAGEPKVADFGVAHLVGELTQLTRSGVVVGTPRYMAPEQVDTEGLREITPRTDVYALGAILYEGLVGQSPHPGETPMEVFAQIVHKDPVPPRRLDASVPRDLETVALKALEKDPRRRYASAEDLARDLERWRTDRPILARPPSLVGRMVRQVRRRKAVAVVSAAGVLAVAVAVGMLLDQRASSRRTLELWREVTSILNNAEIEARSGRVEAARDRLDRGATTCRAFLAEHDVADAHYFLGRLLRARGERGAARAALDAALQREAGMREAHFERGLLLVAEYGVLTAGARATLAGQPPGSEGATPPDQLEVAFPALRTLREQAIADLSVSVGGSDYVRDVDAVFGRAELRRMRWEWSAARSGFDVVLEREPLYAPAHLALAKLCQDLRDPDGALRHADRAIEQHAGLGEAFLVRGRAYFEKAEAAGATRQALVGRANALADLDKAVEVMTDPAAAHAARGIVRWRTGDVDGAILDLDAALATDNNPLRAIALHDRGLVRVSSSDLEGAVADFTAAVEVSPTYAMAYANRAKVRVMLDDVRGAISDVETALRCAPAEAPYRGGLERLLGMLRQ